MPSAASSSSAIYCGAMQIPGILVEADAYGSRGAHPLRAPVLRDQPGAER